MACSRMCCREKEDKYSLWLLSERFDPRGSWNYTTWSTYVTMSLSLVAPITHLQTHVLSFKINVCLVVSETFIQVFQLFGTLFDNSNQEDRYSVSDTIFSNSTNQQIDRKPNNFLLFTIFFPRTNKLSFHLRR